MIEGKISRPLIWVRSASSVSCHFLLTHPIVFKLISRIVEDDVLSLEGRKYRSFRTPFRSCSLEVDKTGTRSRIRRRRVQKRDAKLNRMDILLISDRTIDIPKVLVNYIRIKKKDLEIWDT